MELFALISPGERHKHKPNCVESSLTNIRLDFYYGKIMTQVFETFLKCNKQATRKRIINEFPVA